MSGHSKWHRIKHQKQAADTSRGKQFTRLASQIKQAALQGTDPHTNHALADAIARAKNANMPQAKISRLLDTSASTQETVTYEAYGPGGVAMLIIAQTDNHRRTVAEIRHLLTSHHATLAETGSVLWKFSPTLTIILPKNQSEIDDQLQLNLIDTGATDIQITNETTKIISPPQNKNAILALLKTHQIKPKQIIQGHTALQKNTLAPDIQENLSRLLKDLREQPDIIQVYTDAN